MATPPTRAEALALVRRAQAGDAAARDELVVRNLRLVARVAGWYGSRCLDTADLIAEGVTGVLRAIDLFDTRRGTAFSTYVTWWIRQRIAAAVADHDAIIRKPRGVPDRGHLVRASLDAPLPHRAGDDDSHTFGDLLPDGGAADPADDAERSDQRERIEAAVASLPARDGTILRLRFGLRAGGSAGHTFTLDEVGAVLRISRERVRQLEARAIRRLAKRLAATSHAAAAS